MHWNYRVVKKFYESGQAYFEVCEVHYDENNVPQTCGELMPAESLDELKDDYKHIQTAFEKPVLEFIDGKLLEALENE